MTVGSLITAARYNAMQSKVANVLGVGQEQFGYGQIVSSTQLSVRSVVTELEMQKLKTDIEKTHVHQFGALPSVPTITNTQLITNAQYTSYETASESVLTNKNLIHPTQASLENKIQSTRSLPWGVITRDDTIVHRVRVQFNSTNHARYFFNAGGEIRFSANIANGTGFKTANWANTLNSIGTVRFDYRRTYAGNLPVRNIGFFQLTTEYQTVFVKGNTDLYQNPTDPYESNYYMIDARLSDSLKDIIFRITFYDGNSNEYDESVNGTLTSSVSQYRPTGNYVEVATPGYVNEVLLV
jgi:hypothetical protein